MIIELEGIDPNAIIEDDGVSDGAGRQWGIVCWRLKKWYADDVHCSVYADYLMCKRDAERGLPRAIKYMAEFTAFRLTGE